MALRAAVMALLVTAVASAVECAPVAGAVPELGHVDAQVRLRFIRDRLRTQSRKTRIWAFTWTGLYSAVMVYNLASLNPSDRDNLIDNGVGAGASLVGVLSVALVPPKLIGDQFWLERRLKHAPPGTDVCALLAEAEALLVRDAKSAAFGKSALVHAGNFVFNMGVGILLGTVFGHWKQAALQAGAGIAVGEVMILSQPAEIVRDLQRYRAANLGLPPKWNPVTWTVAPQLSLNYAGIAVGAAF